MQSKKLYSLSSAVVPGVEGDKISCMQSSVNDSLEMCLWRNHTQIPKWAFPDSTELWQRLENTRSGEYYVQNAVDRWTLGREHQDNEFFSNRKIMETIREITSQIQYPTIQSLPNEILCEIFLSQNSAMLSLYV